MWANTELLKDQTLFHAHVLCSSIWFIRIIKDSLVQEQPWFIEVVETCIVQFKENWPFYAFVCNGEQQGERSSTQTSSFRVPAHGIWEESEDRNHILLDYSGERTLLSCSQGVLILVAVKMAPGVGSLESNQTLVQISVLEFWLRKNSESRLKL